MEDRCRESVGEFLMQRIYCWDRRKAERSKPTNMTREKRVSGRLRGISVGVCVRVCVRTGLKRDSWHEVDLDKDRKQISAKKRM